MKQIVYKSETPPTLENIKWTILKGHSISQEIQDDDTSLIAPNENYYWRLLEWERGGSFTNTGYAQIICSIQGEKLKPVYIRGKGHLANNDHALFAGNALVIINASHHRRDFSVSVTRKVVDTKSGKVDISIIWKSPENHDWLDNLPEKIAIYSDAIKSAIEKADCYHCRSVHYSI